MDCCRGIPHLRWLGLGGRGTLGTGPSAGVPRSPSCGGRVPSRGADSLEGLPPQEQPAAARSSARSQCGAPPCAPAWRCLPGQARRPTHAGERPLIEQSRRPCRDPSVKCGVMRPGRLTSRMSPHPHCHVARSPGCRAPAAAANADVGEVMTLTKLFRERPTGQLASG